MSFALGKPIEKEVINQVKARQGLLESSERSLDGGFGFFTQKMPWIRLTSAIDINGSDESAQLNILTNGVNLAGESEVPGYQNTPTLGIRPKPGITSMNLNTHNRFGSLRTATVQFIVHSVDQLDTYEQLFMRPGYSALLEWGHSKYIDSEDLELPVKDIVSLINFFKEEGAPQTKTKLYAKLEELRKNYRYNYDGMYGLVKNFSWSIQQDGTYACSVDIVSIGSILESLNINVAVTNEEISKYSEDAAAASRQERLEEIKNLRGEVETEEGSTSETIKATPPLTENDKQLAEKVNEHFTDVELLVGQSTPEVGGIPLYGFEEYFQDIKNDSVTNAGVLSKDSSGRPKSSANKYRVIGVSNNPVPTIRVLSPPVYFDQSGHYYINQKGNVVKAYKGKNPVPGTTIGKGNDSTVRDLIETYYGILPLPVDGLPPVGTTLQSFPEVGTALYQITTNPGGTGNQVVRLAAINTPNPFSPKLNLQASVIEYVYELKLTTQEAIEEVVVTAAPVDTDEPTLPENEEAAPADDAIDLTNIFEIVASDKQPLKTRIHYILYQAKKKIENNNPAGVTTRDKDHDLNKSDMDLIEINSNYLKLHSKSVTIKAEDDSESTTEGHYSYVQLGFLLDIFNTLLPKDGSKGEKLFEFYTGTSIKHFLKTIKALHYSVDTSKCLLPKEEGVVDILSIFVEISYIETIVESYFSSGKVPLYEVLQTICNDISVSIGSFNDLQVQYFETTNKYHLIDREILDPNAVEDEFAYLSIFGKNSFVRQVNLTSKLSPAIGSQLAIAAQADPQSNGIESSAWNYFNKGLKDRFISQKVDEVTTKQAEAAAKQAASEDAEAKLKAYAEVFDYLRATYPQEGTAFYNYRRAVDSVVPQYAIFCQRQLVSDIQEGRDFGFIIPYELGLTVEGISGFNVMESFKIFDDIIPSTYKSSTKNGIAFIITGLTHTITISGWTTTIKAQIYNTNGKGRAGAPIIKDAETALSPPPISTAEGSSKNLDRGWEGKEQSFVRTTLTYSEAAAAIKKITNNVNLQKSILAVMIREQGRGTSIAGFNHNYGGYDITSGGWRYDSFGSSVSNGYVYAIEGGTNLKKAFVSFVSADAFFEKKKADFIGREFDKADTPRKAAETWYFQWNNKGAQIHWRNNANGIADKYPTLAEYDEYVLANFEKVYKQAEEALA